MLTNGGINDAITDGGPSEFDGRPNQAKRKEEAMEVELFDIRLEEA